MHVCLKCHYIAAVAKAAAKAAAVKGGAAAAAADCLTSRFVEKCLLHYFHE